MLDWNNVICQAKAKRMHKELWQKSPKSNAGHRRQQGPVNLPDETRGAGTRVQKEEAEGVKVKVRAKGPAVKSLLGHQMKSQLQGHQMTGHHWSREK